MPSLSTFVPALLTLVLFAGCGYQPPGGGSASAANMKPVAQDFQGQALTLNPSYSGNCTYKYKSGANASTCSAGLTVAQDFQEISLILSVNVDDQETQVTTGNFRIVGNQIEDDRGVSMGSIGATAVQVSGSQYGTFSIRQMSDGTIGVLVTQLPTMPGSTSSGSAFAASLK